MKLHVTGLETIEATDPKGVCKQAQPAQGGVPAGKPNVRQLPPNIPRPMIPTPFGPTNPPLTPKTTGGKWTRNMQLATAAENLKAGQAVKERMSGNSNPAYTS